MKYIAFIPARGGSKGIPKKNIKIINGKPLIAWTIEAALRCKEIEEVYVSTDSHEIKDIALDFGARVPYLRPAEISNDESSTESAVLHFIDWCSKNDIRFKNLILMQCTSPLRHSNSLTAAIEKFESSKSDSLVTVSKVHRFIWKNPDNPKPNYDILARPRRQDIKNEDVMYFENGSFYITKSSVYSEYKNRLGGKIAMFEMAPEESIEIDEPIDFVIVEQLMKEYGSK